MLHSLEHVFAYPPMLCAEVGENEKHHYSNELMILTVVKMRDKDQDDTTTDILVENGDVVEGHGSIW